MDLEEFIGVSDVEVKWTSVNRGCVTNTPGAL